MRNRRHAQQIYSTIKFYSAKKIIILFFPVLLHQNEESSNIPHNYGRHFFDTLLSLSLLCLFGLHKETVVAS